MTEEQKPALERVTMMWPPALKAAVQEKVGGRGITQFAIGAVETRLAGEDRARALEKEVGELRYLCQLLADRVAMGGDHEDRNHLLMEVELPSWMKTDGWPEDMRGLVPIVPPVVTRVEMPVAPGQAANEVVLGGSARFSDEELAKPAHQVAAEKVAKVAKVDEFVEDPDPAKTLLEQTPEAKDVFQSAGDDLFERVKAKAAEKGIDVSGAGLVPASKIPKPEGHHNHAFERRDDGNLYCECGAWIDESTTPGTLHEAEAELPTEPAPALEVQTPVPTPVAPTRVLDDIEVDF